MMDDSNTKDTKDHKESPIPDDLENIGMGLDCVHCGNPTSWLPCWNCGGEGRWDGEELMEEDPLWYDIDDYRRCDECRGKGGHDYCLECRRIVKVKKDESPGVCSYGYDKTERGT